MAIVVAQIKAPFNWTKHVIHDILLQGDDTHLRILRKLGWPQHRTESMLDIDEIPDILDCTVNGEYIKASVGVLEGAKFGFTLQDVLAEAFLHNSSTSFMLRIGDKCTAIIKDSSMGWSLFDSHACNVKGQRDPEGAACMMCFTSAERLIQHLTLLYPYDGHQIDVFPIYVQIMDQIEDEVLLQSNDSIDDSTQSFRKERYRNIKYEPSLWEECHPKKVESLPFDINGLEVYHIPCSTRAEMMKVSRDGRPWDRYCASSRKDFKGVRRLTHCKGSPECSNEDCLFRSMYGCKNRRQFKKENSISVCHTCGKPADMIKCSATKVWEYCKDFVVVMHIGDHTCVAKKAKVSVASLQQDIQQNPGLKPSTLVSHKMMQIMSVDDFDWNDVEDIAKKYSDLKQVHNARERMKKEILPLGENFEALADFKSRCEQKDRFFIYKINNRAFNGEHTFVFKSSKEMAELALSMDKDKGGLLANEYAYIDGKHNHCRGYVTLTLWVYHPVIRRIVRLAASDTEKEDTSILSLTVSDCI
ncbi:uncharacterized protein LOC117122751 [Anneissia japonica]|uniref:uncharacterized protein LOC117122751 n=1 Tax=Anneissia japonica TaxID=1529436 RepID=UPI001425679A|nr:uncharacterized protein LOC117122751 [Anneissia japonica]